MLLLQINEGESSFIHSTETVENKKWKKARLQMEAPYDSQVESQKNLNKEKKCSS